MNILKLDNALDLARASGVAWGDFLKIVKYPNSNYNVFNMKKKSGGTRIISVPKENLDKIQQVIYEQILSKVKIHSSAFGFVKGKSILDNAKFHMDSEKVLSIDLKNFYPSIKKARLYYLFMNLCGYSKEVSDTLVRLVSVKKGIPQGARTSPSISNIVTYRLDTILCEFSKKHNIKYTRYADDLTFSGKKEDLKDDFYYKVKWIVEKQGFEINSKKTYFSKVKTGAMITGLRVYNDRVIVPRKYVNRVDTELHYLEKYGIKNVKKRQNIYNRNYLGHLAGK